MASATPNQVASVTAGLLKNSPEGLESEGRGPKSAAQSERQQRLDRLWQFYKCTNYEARSIDWDGNPVMEPAAFDQIAHSGFIPPGFYNAGDEGCPLEFRKPSVPYYLCKVIVNRFTSLLFSQRRHPKLVCEDKKTQDWLLGFAEATRLWSRMGRARTFGGATGSCGIGFKFVKGKPAIEVFDPRYTTPEFADRSTKELKKLEIRYQYVQEVRLPDGEWEDKIFWYRRIIDSEIDCIWPKVPVEDGEEPDWKRQRYIEKQHGLGEVPAVWIQNTDDDDDIDGEPDCQGAYEPIKAIDQLQSQAYRGTKANCDPGVVISSDAEFDSVKKGTGNALHVEKGGNVNYMEMTGGGITKAMELVEVFENQALIVTCCYIDKNEGGPAKTAAEVEKQYSAMVDRADAMREQYGESGVKELLEKVLRAAHKLSGTSIDRSDPELPRVTRHTIKLPKGKHKDEDTGVVTYYERELGEADACELEWPEYFEPSLDTVNKAVDAAGKAKTAGIIDLTHAVRLISQYFNIENVNEVVDNLKKEQETMMQQGRLGFPGGDPVVEATEAPSL